MITPTELSAYLDTLRAAGVTGPVEIAGIKLTISPPEVVTAAPVARRSAKAEYDAMLFACTEGIPEDEELVP
jgi:hypothetical protein